MPPFTEPLPPSPAVPAGPAGAPATVVVPVVHAVTTPALLAQPEFVLRARGVMAALGPRGAVHLRGHDLTARQLFDLACLLREAQAATGCWLVVNDRLDVALAAGARGAQLTSRSMRPDDARIAADRARSRIALGASIHAVAEARAAEAAGAAWVVAGHVYATPSHAGAAGAGVRFVHEVAAAVRVPVVAIGGVTPADVPALRAAGAHGVAVIRGVWDASDAERAATDYLASYDADAAPGRDDRPDGERRAARDG